MLQRPVDQDFLGNSISDRRFGRAGTFTVSVSPSSDSRSSGLSRATAISSFYRAGLIDEAWIFSAAVLLGDERVPQAITGLRTKRMRDAARPRILSVKTIGHDVLHRLRFNEPPT